LSTFCIPSNAAEIDGLSANKLAFYLLPEHGNTIRIELIEHQQKNSRADLAEGEFNPITS
jgi:hypothetical protein